MSNYTQTTFFAPKDALLTGNPAKLIKGSEVDPELAAIATAIATKFDASSIGSAPVGFADGTAPLPSIMFASSPTTGLYKSAANQIGFSTNGVARGNIGATGTWTIAAPTSGNALQVSGFAGSPAVIIIPSAATDVALDILAASASNATISLRLNAVQQALMGVSGAAGQLISGSVLNDLNIRSINGNLNFASLGSGSSIMLQLSSSAAAIAARGPTAAALVDLTPDFGTFTGTPTGGTGFSPATVTCRWARVGNLVTLIIPATTGTSNSTSFTMTGLPAAIQPNTSQTILLPVGIENNSGGSQPAQVTISASGTMTFLWTTGTVSFSATGFTASATKGIYAPLTISYLLT